MSLAQHVSSFEGVDQEYDDITELRLERFPSLSLSYDPLPAIAQGQVEKLESQPAYEVPQRIRIGRPPTPQYQDRQDVERPKRVLSFSILTSANLGGCHHLFHRVWDCLWVRRSQDYPDPGKGVPGVL